MTIYPVLLTVAVGINLATAIGAYLKRAVSASGAAGGFIVGTVTLYTGGFLYWIALMLFFGSSTVASRVGAGIKADLDRVHEKGSRRDLVQVFANAGVPVAALVLLALTNEPLLAVAAASAFASANADTWASEIGVLSRHRPRSVLTRRELAPGTSGGTTPLGTTAAAAGSLLIALWFAAGLLVSRFTGPAPIWQGLVALPSSVGAAAGAVFLAGSLGSLIDSVLGATVQGQFAAEHGEYTEQRSRISGSGRVRNTRVRGVRWVTNDLVNFLSCGTAAVVGTLLAWVVL